MIWLLKYRCRRCWGSQTSTLPIFAPSCRFFALECLRCCRSTSCSNAERERQRSEEGRTGEAETRRRAGGDGGEAAAPEKNNACGRKDGWRRRDTGSNTFQRGGRNPPLRSSERGPRPGEAYVCPGRQPPAPTRVGWSGNLLGLPFAEGVQFEL